MERIIVGVDGSEISNGALRWAIDEARRREATVVAVHAYPRPDLPYSSVHVDAYVPASMVEEVRARQGERQTELAKAAQAEADAVVAGALEAVGGDPSDVPIERVTVIGEAARTLVEMSRDATLLVLGSRGRGGFKGLLLGSVSQQCLHHATCPVVVLRRPVTAGDPDG